MNSLAKSRGRNKEADVIEAADKAVAVGRLMLGELATWEEFLHPATVDYTALPRRQLKSGVADVQQRLKTEIGKFCSQNFVSLGIEGLSALFEEIKINRGLEVPLKDFEKKYGKIHPQALKGAPAHLTISISLWGLKFRFPEDMLAKDIVTSLRTIRTSKESLRKYETWSHRSASGSTEEFIPALRNLEFAQRAAVLSCFNLLEAYLNGLAWDYCQRNALDHLSNRERDALTDISSASIAWKIDNYPRIISGQPTPNLVGRKEFLDEVKPFRDSLAHPSPFTKPEKFGGYHKLQKFYALDEDVVRLAVASSLALIASIHHVVTGDDEMPAWCQTIRDEIVSDRALEQLTIA